jgi:hypothetical protein
MKGHVGGGPGFNVFKALTLGKKSQAVLTVLFTYPFVIGI